MGHTVIKSVLRVKFYFQECFSPLLVLAAFALVCSLKRNVAISKLICLVVNVFSISCCYLLKKDFVLLSLDMAVSDLSIHSTCLSSLSHSSDVGSLFGCKVKI